MPFSLIACQFSWETKSLMYACVCVCCAWGWVEWSEQNSFHHKSNATPAPLLEHWFVTIFHLIFSWSPIATKYADVRLYSVAADRGIEEKRKKKKPSRKIKLVENDVAYDGAQLGKMSLERDEPHTHTQTQTATCATTTSLHHIETYAKLARTCVLFASAGGVDSVIAATQPLQTYSRKHDGWLDWGMEKSQRQRRAFANWATIKAMNLHIP